MKSHHLSVLVLAVAVALAAAFWASSLREAQTEAGAMLFPALRDRLNDVTTVRLITAGEITAATLGRGDC